MKDFTGRKMLYHPFLPSEILQENLLSRRKDFEKIYQQENFIPSLLTVRILQENLFFRRLKFEKFYGREKFIPTFLTVRTFAGKFLFPAINFEVSYQGVRILYHPFFQSEILKENICFPGK